MQTVKGSIWSISKPLDYLVIPTNIGWRKDGTAVMGAGLARQAAQRYEELELWYGDQCLRHGARTPVLFHRPRAAASRNLVLFPVKPCKELHPWLSWDQPASLELIERSTEQLADAIHCGRDLTREHYGAIVPGNRRVFIPLVGCGNGKLEEAQVLPVLEKHLGAFANVWLVQR